MNANAITRYPWIGYTAARSNLAYVGEAAARTLFMAVVLYIFMCLWTVVYSSSGSDRLGGLRLKQMLWYLMMTESIALSSVRASMEIDEDVRTGRLAVQLLRPSSYVLARLAQGLGERLVRFGVNVVTGAVVAAILTGTMAFSPVGVVMLAVVLPIAFVLDYLAYFFIGMFAFWFESTAGLSLIYTRSVMLLGGMLLPVEVYPHSLQPVIRALPFASMMYGPARVFVSGDRDVFIRTVITQLCALLVFGVAVWAMQQIAVKRIQSNGG